jgi:hypothetical protein
MAAAFPDGRMATLGLAAFTPGMGVSVCTWLHEPGILCRHLQHQVIVLTYPRRHLSAREIDRDHRRHENNCRWNRVGQRYRSRSPGRGVCHESQTEKRAANRESQKHPSREKQQQIWDRSTKSVHDC